MFAQKLAGISGSERYLLSIMPELARRGADVSFLMIREGAPNEAQAAFARELHAHGIPTHAVAAGRTITPASVWRFRSVLRTVRPDIVQTNLLHADAHGAAAVALLGTPPILVSAKHGYTEPFQRAHGFDAGKVPRDTYAIATWAAARRADAVVSISTGLANLLTGSGLVAAGKSRVIPYGFDFSDERSATPEGSLRHAALQIVAVSRLVDYKRIDLLIAALPRLASRFAEVKLVIVGDGPLRAQLEGAAAAGGVADRVVFAGHRPNALDYIRDSDVLALPSTVEGFGRVIMEAWWHRKPVVCFDVPAPNEIVSDEVNGLLVPPRDAAGSAAGLAAALERLLADASARRRLGANGRRTLDTRHTIDAMVGSTLALYEELMARRRGT